ncbi:RsmB/NOP family class I SAM-dependent RNA methyltransferase, partial [Pseudorhodobacter sp.]|uniref:RsmB/NOP family class I SAM-dependent RNA methyltransferase n=1 Tax=Pseudorhodobacter sp. TaxID=1934400 RepID=UPI00264A0B67
MTPAARHAAAIDVLDVILAGTAAEKALTNWARGNRYAGSGDRNAVRDIVFDVMRCKRSFACLGGAETGRGLVLGALRAAGISPENLFTGEGYAPSKLTVDELTGGRHPSGNAALDCPEWLAPEMRQSLGQDFEAVMLLLQRRAPVFVRVNRRKATPAEVIAALGAEGIAAQPAALSETALEVTRNPRKIQVSKPFQSGMIELQDAASQAVINRLPLCDGQRVLDYCAGGGGKTLAMAGRVQAQFFAHDIAPERMNDLSKRALRAGVQVETLTTAALAQTAPFDLVLADAPCSGSGSWRRAPEAKWALTEDRLTDLRRIQAEILDRASNVVAKTGSFAYATCSLLRAENEDLVKGFL